MNTEDAIKANGAVVRWPDVGLSRTCLGRSHRLLRTPKINFLNKKVQDSVPSIPESPLYELESIVDADPPSKAPNRSHDSSAPSLGNGTRYTAGPMRGCSEGRPMDGSLRRVLRNPRTRRATRGHRDFAAEHTAAAGASSALDVTWTCGPYTTPPSRARGPRNPRSVI